MHLVGFTIDIHCDARPYEPQISNHNSYTFTDMFIKPLNDELNPIYPLLALFGAHHILHVSRMRVKRLLVRPQAWALIRPQ